MASATWERVSEDGGVTTHRMKIADGWLYRVTTGYPQGIALAFVPSTAVQTASDDTAPEASNPTTEDTPRLDD